MREVIELLDQTLNDYEKSIKDLECLNDKFKKTCFWYSEEIYRFLGNFRKDNLDPKQLAALDILKDVVDSRINDDYRERLEAIYINKNFFKSINDESLTEQIKEIQNNYFSDINCNIEDIEEE